MKKKLLISIALCLALVTMLFGCKGNLVPIAFSGGTLAEGTVGTEYSATVAATGTDNIEYSLKTGSILPLGLNLNSQGTISGIPTEVITSKSIIIIATASGATSAEATFTITVKKIAIEYSGATLAPATAGLPYSADIATATGKTGIQYNLKTPGELPEGLSLSKAGVISGTPAAIVSNAQFTVIASAENATSAEVQFTLTVVPAGTIVYTGTTLFNAKRNLPYSASVAMAAGAPDITYALKVAGSLPKGLEMSAAGIISGTPTAAVSETTFVVIASAESLTSVEATFKITVLDVDPTRYTFETEYIDVSELLGAGSSGSIGGKEMIQSGPKASNENYLGYTNRKNLAMEYVIQSDHAASAVLTVRLGSEIGLMEMNPTVFEIKVNDTVINYRPFTIPNNSNSTYFDFTDFVIVPGITLRAETNNIVLTVKQNNYINGSTAGPLVDCIYVETVAALTWNPILSNI